MVRVAWAVGMGDESLDIFVGVCVSRGWLELSLAGKQDWLGNKGGREHKGCAELVPAFSVAKVSSSGEKVPWQVVNALGTGESSSDQY